MSTIVPPPGDLQHGPRIGELFAGYGGLGLGVQALYGGSIAWVSDICRMPTEKDDTTHYAEHRGPCRVLAHRFPGVPNHGDVTRIDWSQVEPVDVLTGGSPCQDLSHAGRRAGMTEGTRSNLWVAMREAIAQLRPPMVVWENVGGAYSACADSELGRCARCVDPGAPGGHDPRLRALGRVLGDLSDLGYDARWHGLRAADVGAPHGRLRVFVVATDATGNARRFLNRDDCSTPAHAARDGWDEGRAESTGVVRRPHAAERGHDSGVALLPSPRTSDTNGAGQHGDGGLDLRTAVTLLGTPRASEWKGSGPVGSKSHDHMAAREYLSAQVLNLLPTLRVKNNENRQSEQFRGEDGNFHGLLHNPERWGDYADAIARWENVLGRPAPAPTMTSSKGNPQLSPAFTEWMMGLPAGWITDVPGVTRNEALKLCGNGVVPQQAAEALRVMASWEVAA